MAKGYGPTVREQIQKGELTYEAALLLAPYANGGTKKKWLKDAKARKAEKADGR